MKPDGSILVIDDDPDIRESIADALQEEGYRVAVAANGKDALRRLRDEALRPDVILLDIMMPVMDGWSFRAEQRSDPELASIPVLIFTAYGSPKDIARELEAAGTLRKPLRLEELLAAIDRVRRQARGDRDD